MAKVRIANRFSKNVRTKLMSSNSPTQRQLVIRGVKVVNAAKRRLGSNPKRIDTGLLRASITMEPIKPIGVRVGTNVKYAMFVHDGTSRMAANPFLTDALKQVIHN